MASTTLPRGEQASWGSRIWLAAVGSAGLALLAGCGLAANPQPPTLWLPEPVKDLTATRVSDEVHLHWTMPKNTTDKVALKGDQRAHFCWEDEASAAVKAAAVKAAAAKAAAENEQAASRQVPGGMAEPAAKQSGPPPLPLGFDPKTCRALGDGMFAPDKAADFMAKMPAELTSGTPRVVGFYLELQNHAGKTAGPSNAAWIATGPAPPGVTGLRLETRAEGLVLHWDPSAPQPHMVLRIHRTLVPNAGAAKPDESKGATPAEAQVLEVDLDKTDPGGAVDRDAQLDHEWKDWAERVVKLDVNAHTVEIAGTPSQTVTIDAKDVFPPAIPSGVTVVADAQAKAMDLSWTPDTEADIAGYVVYRRDVTAGGSMERITPKAVVSPSYSDGMVVAGHQYAYAVSAVDQDGNESARSAEVVEGLPE